jgi:hypothetical protein
MTPILAALAFAALAAQAAPAQVTEQRIDGPNVVCGIAFALRIGAGEHVIRREAGTDFLTYYVVGPEYGSFVLYEGNYPQPHDDAIETGRDWPRLIAVHDNREPAAKLRGRVRDRLLTGAAGAALCPARGQARQ